jgi:hypothetical protein
MREDFDTKKVNFEIGGINFMVSSDFWLLVSGGHPPPPQR